MATGWFGLLGRAATALAVAALLGGGLGIWPRGSTADDVLITYPAQRTFVHGPGGVELAAEAYPGELPVVEQRFVAEFGAQEPDLDFAADGAALYYS